MADISQYVAQFGRGSGSGLTSGYERGRRNRLAEQQRQDVMQERNLLALAQQQQDQRDFLQQGVEALQSVPEAQQPQVYAGWYNEAQRRGYDLQGEPTPDQYGPQVLAQMRGAAGVAAPGAGARPAGVVEFERMTEGLTPEQREQARLVSLGLQPRAVGTGAITAATTPGLTEQVAGSEAAIAGARAGATEGARLQQQAQYEPAIRSAIKTAETEAKSRGETLSELARAQAAMPGLEQAVSDLRELAPIATYTLAGKFWDQAVKQTGFGATEGATARAKYTAILDNQVLPLLRQTFGAAFTAAEGERLRATMGDPDASPETKIAQLEAFIAQKYRDIESKERELGAQPPGAGPAAQPPVQGARQAPDGNWYVEQNGQFFRVDQ